MKSAQAGRNLEGLVARGSLRKASSAWHPYHLLSAAAGPLLLLLLVPAKAKRWSFSGNLHLPLSSCGALIQGLALTLAKVTLLVPA